MSAENTGNYYTFVSPAGDAAPWTATHKSYRAPQHTSRREASGVRTANPGRTASANHDARSAKPSEPVFVEAHIIDEHDTPSGRKTTWANTGNNPSAGFQTSWTGTASRKPKSNLIPGVIQTAAGLGLMAIGVPMLILPGPGLAVIAGGALLAGAGARKVLGKQ